MNSRGILLLFLGGVALLTILGGESRDLFPSLLFLLLTAIAVVVAVRSSKGAFLPFYAGQPLILTAGLSPLPAVMLEILLLGLVLGIAGILVHRWEYTAYGAAGGISLFLGTLFFFLPGLVFQGIALLLVVVLISGFLLFSRERFRIQCQGAE